MHTRATKEKKVFTGPFLICTTKNIYPMFKSRRRIKATSEKLDQLPLINFEMKYEYTSINTIIDINRVIGITLPVSFLSISFIKWIINNPLVSIIITIEIHPNRTSITFFLHCFQRAFSHQKEEDAL